jgi:hypothetical protein
MAQPARPPAHSVRADVPSRAVEATDRSDAPSPTQVVQLQDHSAAAATGGSPGVVLALTPPRARPSGAGTRPLLAGTQAQPAATRPWEVEPVPPGALRPAPGAMPPPAPHLPGETQWVRGPLGMRSCRIALPTRAGRVTDRSVVTSGPLAGAASAGIGTGGATGSSSAGGDQYSGPSPITTCSPMCSGPTATGPTSTIRCSGTTDMRISGPACFGLMATTTSSVRRPFYPVAVVTPAPVAVVTPATHTPVAMRRRLQIAHTHPPRQ